jgi:hypothetical protein
MVMRFLFGWLAVLLEEVGESRIILIMHGGGAATFTAARYLVTAVYVVLSAKHCQYLRCCDRCYHNTDPTDGVTQPCVNAKLTGSPGITASSLCSF